MVARFALVFGVILIGYLAVVVQIVLLATKHREAWLAQEEKRVSTFKRIPPNRGNIYDCHGNLLAGSVPEYQVYMDMRIENFDTPLRYDTTKHEWRACKKEKGTTTVWNYYVDTLAYSFAHIVGEKSEMEYRRMFRQYREERFLPRKRNRHLNKMSRPISYQQMKELQQSPLICKGVYRSGISFDKHVRRLHPYGTMALRTIGRLNKEDKGITGLEAFYDTLLCGKGGISERTKMENTYTYVVREEAVDGCDIITTLDANLQDICEHALRQRATQLGAEWGCVVLMEVETGEVKAMANLDRQKDGTYAETSNHAVVKVEPGSTFKTVTLMAALDDGKIDYENSKYEVYKRGWDFPDSKTPGHVTHTDDRSHQMDTIWSCRDALMVSSNIAFAKMMTESYGKKADKFVDKAKKMGLTDSVPFPLINCSNPLIRVHNDAVTLSKMAYGYSVELSPLQTLMFYNGIANHGKMISPILVKEIRKDDEVIQTYSPRVMKGSLCSNSVLRDVQDALHAVVHEPLGTGKSAQSKIVSIAGKTGTAQIQERGGYSHSAHRISFVGYFPEEKPKYSCICVMQRAEGSGNAAVVVRQIAERTMAYAGTLNSKALAVPKDSINRPQAKGAVLHAAPTEHQMPNVMGMGAMDAVYAIERTGRRVRIQGQGRVVGVQEENGYVTLTLR